LVAGQPGGGVIGWDCGRLGEGAGLGSARIGKEAEQMHLPQPTAGLAAVGGTV